MRKIIFVAQYIILMFFFSSVCYAVIPSEVKGEVSWSGKQCSYCIIQTSQYYVLVEVQSGSLNKDDQVEGELHAYNFKTITDTSHGKNVRVYIENYWSSKDRCFEWLKQHNKCSLEE